MNQSQCTGLVRSLRGQHTLFTGRLIVDGQHMPRHESWGHVEARGGTVTNDESRHVDLLVFGDQGNRELTDPGGYSQKLVFAERLMREEKIHIHVIDGDGFGNLLKRRPAHCRPLKRKRGKVILEPRTDPLFGQKVGQRRISTHDTTPLTIDLTALDEGSKAHQETLLALQDVLKSSGITAYEPATGAPLFDAGYDTELDRVIVEVKSLSAVTREAQQIRLGLGQLLEYKHLASKTGPVRAVLALEQEPKSTHWVSVAADAGLLLTWAPDFPHLPV